MKDGTVLGIFGGALFGWAVGAGASRVRQDQRDGAAWARNQAMNGIFGGVVLGDRGNLEHGMGLMDIAYPWRAPDDKVRVGHTWAVWFTLPVIALAVTALALITYGSNAPADPNEGVYFAFGVAVILAIGPLATLILAAIANKRHKTRQNRVYIEDAHRRALEYWRVREALRADLQAGHVRCDEARYHLTNTWLGGYFVNAPAVPMAWTTHRPGITQG